MTAYRRTVVSSMAVAAIGAAAATGTPILMALTVLFPALCLVQSSRRSGLMVGLAYYAGALWPLVPGARNFFGPATTIGLALSLWATSSGLLAFPWYLLWSPNRRSAMWRGAVGILCSVVPPLGLIGWANPLATAGVLFPGTKWFGLAAVLLSAGALAAFPRPTIAAVLACSGLTNWLYRGDPPPLGGWEAVNTTFGGIAHDANSPLVEFTAAQWIQERALLSKARVLIFPETVVPMWTEATDLFWHQTLAALAASGKTILIGAGTPASCPSSNCGAAVPHYNSVVIRGSLNDVFYQRVPVPLAMWKPFSPGGVPLNLAGEGSISVAGQNVAILVCYEQLISWLILTSMINAPTVVIAIANDYWATGTPIPKYQAGSVRAWARLFGIPYLTAVNR